LRTAVETFGRDWIRVSEYVGGGITANQCCMHWDNVVDPQVAALKPKFKGPWTPDEVCMCMHVCVYVCVYYYCTFIDIHIEFHLIHWILITVHNWISSNGPYGTCE
jgi:hypothetical protein